MRLKVYVLEVRKTNKGPQVFVSRTHPGLVKRLFELEVPEIHAGLVQIKGIAREAGSRTKYPYIQTTAALTPLARALDKRDAC